MSTYKGLPGLDLSTEDYPQLKGMRRQVTGKFTANVIPRGQGTVCVEFEDLNFEVDNSADKALKDMTSRPEDATSREDKSQDDVLDF